MGDRYFLQVTCPKCKFTEEDVYYAPTCGFTEWVCPKCGEKVDLEEYTGISYEDCSNAGLINAMVESLKHGKKEPEE